MDHDNATLATLVSKLEALLRNGKVKTDVVFLVGPDDNTVEEISAIKSDLVASSEYFSRLFSSTWSRPDEEGNQKIRLKNIEGRIFSLVVEYVHLNGLLLSKLSSLDECLQLMQAADEFLMKDLLLLCTKQLEGRFLAVDNVWKVLGDLHHCDEVASVCLKFLRQRTKDCLRHESFSGVGREPIRLFMALDQMQIDSELELLQACLSFSKSHDNPKEIFRQYFLPHLRLLTLSWNDVQVVKQMLTREEMASLAFYHLSANGRQPLEEPWPSSLCLKESRAKTKTLITVPESRVLDNVKVMEIFLTDLFEWVIDLCWFIYYILNKILRSL